MKNYQQSSIFCGEDSSRFFTIVSKGKILIKCAKRTVFLTVTLAALSLCLCLSSAQADTFYHPGLIYFYPTPIYQIKVRAIIMADDDGSNQAEATPSDIDWAVNEANDIFASAGIELIFDSNIDVEYIDSTFINHDYTVTDDLTSYTDPNNKPPPSILEDPESHSLARTQYASQLRYRNKMVVFFRATEKKEFEWSVNDGHWIVLKRGSSSGAGGNHVNMGRGYFTGSNLSHEMGHYLHNRHPMVSGISTKTQAEQAVNGYLLTHPLGEALDKLDRDYNFVHDTPADAAGSIYESLVPERYKCDPDPAGEIWLDVVKGSVEHQVLLNPDRRNIMSYFMDCGFQNHFSPNQAARSRDALENGNRHRLISARLSATSGPLILQGLASGGLASDLHITRTRHRQLVTTLIAGNGKLKLIAWHVDEYGKITRKGDIETLGEATRVEVASMGLGILVTAVRTSSGLLKMILWEVDDTGNITRMGSYGYSSQVTDIGIARVGPEYLLTGIRTDAGELRMLAWETSVRGWIKLLAEASGGEHSFLSMAPIQTKSRAVTVMRNEAGNLKLISWFLYKKQEEVFELLRSDEDWGGGTFNIAALGLDTDRLVTAIRTSTNHQKLIVWHTGSDGTLIRSGDVTANQIVHHEAARLGTDIIGTASVTSGDHRLDLAVWKVSPDGSIVEKRLNTGPLFQVIDVAITQVDWGKIAVAVTDKKGKLLLMIWSVQDLLFPGDFNYDAPVLLETIQTDLNMQFNSFGHTLSLLTNQSLFRPTGIASGTAAIEEAGSIGAIGNGFPSTFKFSWELVLPREALPPQDGTVILKFAINEDGNITGVVPTPFYTGRPDGNPIALVMRDPSGNPVILGHLDFSNVRGSIGSLRIEGIRLVDRPDGVPDLDIASLQINDSGVNIDIKPMDDSNSINLGSKGVTPVAILSSPTFNPMMVDPHTVFLAGASVKIAGNKNLLVHAEDVNEDGIDDLVCHFETAQLLLNEGDSIAVIEAQTFNGIQIRGQDSVRIVSDKKFR